MKIKYVALIGAAIISCLAGCAGEPYVLNSVGPAPVNTVAFRTSGYLRVYTATETHEVGDNTYYYPHTGYYIYTEFGTLLKYVPNNTAVVDETPAWVAVPSGIYTIKAQSDLYSTVTVPVVVKENRTTEVHLDSGWKPPLNVSTNQLVYLQNGEAVGWSSSIKNSSE